MQLYIKYKATQQFGILDEALLEDENGNVKQFEMYSNLNDYIGDYEEAMELDRQKRKGILHDEDTGEFE